MIRSARWLVPVAILVPTRAWALHVPDDYLTIQEAVDAASEWDTIFVDGSLYTTENPVTITKNIIIRPEKSADTPDTGADTGTVTSPATVYYPNFLVIEASLRLYDGVIQTYRDMAGSSSTDTFSGQAGIAMLGSGELMVEDVSFFDGPGYAIFATDATVWVYGGVISGFYGTHALKVTSWTHDAQLVVDGTSFENNTQNAIYVADYLTHYTSVDVTGATFVNNQSYEYGGDIWLHQVDTATITGISSFGSSAANAGGSIMLRGTPATISSSSFTSNYAAFAGAIYVEGDGDVPAVSLADVDFVSNMATGGAEDLAYGGDMSVVNASASLERVDSVGAAGAYGGSIAALNSTVYVLDGHYTGASAEAGGVFFGDGSALAMEGTEVCEVWGGASVIQSIRGSVQLNRAFFQSNTVDDGPMVQVGDADLSVFDTTLVANSATPGFYGSGGGVTVVNTLFRSSGTVEALEPVYFYAGYNLYSDAGDGSEYSTLGKDVYADPVFWRGYEEGVCGSQALLASGSPGAGQGYAVYDVDIGAFPVVDGPDDTGVVETGIVETGVTDTDTAVEPHTGGDDTAPTPDSDGDGTPDAADCAPGDPDIYPGAYDDPLDDIDQDCDGDAADGLAHGGCGCGTPGPAGAVVVFAAALALAVRRRAAG